jgi:hypothetical protein
MYDDDDRETWAEAHGYHYFKCRACGWSGQTDGDGCEVCPSDDDVETCDHCEKETSECECWSCEDCDEKNDDDDRHCSHCEKGRSYQTMSRSTVHVARKAHKTYGQPINPGDTYRRTVTGGYKVDGPRWLTVSRTLLKRKV